MAAAWRRLVVVVELAYVVLSVEREVARAAVVVGSVVVDVVPEVKWTG